MPHKVKFKIHVLNKKKPSLALLVKYNIQFNPCIHIVTDNAHSLIDTEEVHTHRNKISHVINQIIRAMASL